MVPYLLQRAPKDWPLGCLGSSKGHTGDHVWGTRFAHEKKRVLPKQLFLAPMDLSLAHGVLLSPVRFFGLPWGLGTKERRVRHAPSHAS